MNLEALDLEASKKKVAALTEPRNVVLVGASDRPGSWAARVWRNLKQYEFPGPALSDQSAPHGNLRRPLLSRLQVAAGAARPPRRAGAGAGVPEVLRSGAAAGARSATVFSSGFGEAFDTDAAPLGRELEAVIAETGLAVSGPNCMGNICAKSRLVTLSEDRPLLLREGPVALVGQSGGMMIFLNRRARRARHGCRIPHHQRQRGRARHRRLHRVLRRSARAESHHRLYRGDCRSSRNSRRRAAWRAPPARRSSP